MLINSAREWKENGCYWAWSNVSGTVGQCLYRTGSPTINQLMVEGGLAHDTEESVYEWLRKEGSGFDELEIAEINILTLEDYCDAFGTMIGVSSLAEVYERLDKQSEEVRTVFYPPGKYLLRKDITKEALLKLGVKLPTKTTHWIWRLFSR